MNNDKTLIIDFDSTFITAESLDILAEMSLREIDAKEKDDILKKFASITRHGMEGKIPFGTSLELRLSLIKPHKDDIQQLIHKLHGLVTPSFIKNRSFIQEYSHNIYVVSGAFKEYMVPVLSPFGVQATHIFGNEFVFEGDTVIGYDKKNVLSRTGGKAELVKSLQIQTGCIIVGDGHTDYEILKGIAAGTFVAFTENVRRNRVVKKASYEAKNFGNVIRFLNEQ